MSTGYLPSILLSVISHWEVGSSFVDCIVPDLPGALSAQSTVPIMQHLLLTWQRSQALATVSHPVHNSI